HNPTPQSQPGDARFCQADITLTEWSTRATPTRRWVTGSKWRLSSWVLTCEQSESQDTSEQSWRMGSQLSSVSGPVDLKIILLSTHLVQDLVRNQEDQDCQKYHGNVGFY
ncbi:hypothetical protein GOODEAATRI_008733, partial [Goodea atripinnis]